MARRRRITANRLDLVAGGLTDRDRAVLDVLAVVGVAATDQLARIVFGDAISDTAGRLARRSLQRLRRDGLVRRFEDRAWDRRAGAPGYVHALTGSGLRLVGGDSGPGAGQRRAWRPTYQFLTHRLAITELYVKLVEQERAGGPRVLEFAAEAAAARSFSGPGGTKRLLPDALVRLAADGVEVSNFIEVDKGTETRATIMRKAQNYRTYELTGDEIRRHGVMATVLFVVSNPERARVIQRLIHGLDPDLRELFAVALEADTVRVLSEAGLPTEPERPPP
jgi:hypothetical protein